MSDDVHSKLKLKTVKEDTSIQEVVEQFILDYVNENEENIKNKELVQITNEIKQRTEELLNLQSLQSKISELERKLQLISIEMSDNSEKTKK